MLSWLADIRNTKMHKGGVMGRIIVALTPLDMPRLRLLVWLTILRGLLCLADSLLQSVVELRLYDRHRSEDFIRL